MFRRSEPFYGQFGLAGTLALDQASVLPPLREGIFGSIADVVDRLAALDWTPDLGANIGSRTWFRGAATCVALCAVCISLFPEYRPIAVSTSLQANGDAWEESRAQSIAPAAWGGDSGKRMAATDAVVPLNSAPERPTIELTASLGQGDGFQRVLERAGVGANEANRASQLVSGAIALGEIKPGTQIKITLGRRANRNMPRPLDLLAFRAKIDLALAIKRVGGGLSLDRMPIAVDRSPLRVQGRVGDSLYLSARAAGVPGGVVQNYLRALSEKVSFGEIDPDARFDLVVEHARAATGETETGNLLYAGLYNGKKMTQLLQWTVEGRQGWFEASGVGQQRGGMVRPVEFARISSRFGMRIHPLLGYSRFHRGTDYAASYGTPIRAVTDGFVAFAGRSGGYGNFVKLQHRDGIGTGYGHMSRIAVSSGTRVVRGQVIGYVGSTGFSTGPHLHFEVYRGGQAVSPNAVNFTSTPLLAGRELQQFKAKLAALTSLPVGGSAGGAP